MTRIASHRGGTLDYGDSTPRGFAASAQMALEELEFDVHPTKDGAIVVHHDATLDRTTDTSGAISDKTLAEVKAATIHYAEGGHPLTLEELCALYRTSHVTFRCEIKPGADYRPYPDFVPKVVETLRRENMLERTGFSSFLVENLDALAAATDRPKLWLISPQVLWQLGPQTILELCKSHQITEIAVQAGVASADLMAEITAGGVEFGVYGAHDAKTIDHVLALGVKVFTTDRPHLAIARREAFRGKA